MKALNGFLMIQIHSCNLKKYKWSCRSHTGSPSSADIQGPAELPLRNIQQTVTDGQTVRQTERSYHS